jgi:hypothetical protein
MKTTIRNILFTAIVIMAFACKNSSHDTDNTTMQNGEPSASEMETNDPANSGTMNDATIPDDSTSTGTTNGNNGAQDPNIGAQTSDGVDPNTGETEAARTNSSNKK